MTAECKWNIDEICVNADCPMCADYCPVVNYPDVCRHEVREYRAKLNVTKENEKMSLIDKKLKNTVTSK